MGLETQVVEADRVPDGGLFRAVFQGDADDPEIRALVQLVEVGDLDLAQGAPGCPETHQHPFAPVVRQADGAVVDVGEDEGDGLGRFAVNETDTERQRRGQQAQDEGVPPGQGEQAHDTGEIR